jgi:Fungal N-terminal domain of STAND proteins
MDPISITTGALSIVASIGKLTITVTRFVRQVRDARGDLDAISRELVSLSSILEILAEDVSNPGPNGLPESIAKQIQGILNGCDGVVVQLAETLSKFDGNSLKTKGAWALNGRGDMDKLRSSLEAHKSALNIAVDMLSLYVSRSPPFTLAQLQLSQAILATEELSVRSYRSESTFCAG